ncbi:MAG TPA: BrnT family toxin [Candidatus Paceibacterota bacterium]
MKEFQWDPLKNELLKQERGISFEEVVVSLNSGPPIDYSVHPNQKKYRNQMMYKILIRDYVYLVPCIRKGEVEFLKTIIPSRKATKDYFKNNKK